MPKKAPSSSTPKKKAPAKSKKDKKNDKKSLHQEFADIIEGVDVDAKKPERVKREVDRFGMERLSLVPTTHRETKFEKGTGETLRDISKVAKNIRSHEGDDTVIKKVHQLLYGRPGKGHETKRNIMRFNGLASKGKKEGKERFHSKLSGWKMNDLRAAAKLFVLDSSSASKEDLVDALVDFLASPKASKLKKKSITKKKPSKRKAATSESESESAESSAASESEAESSASESEKEEEKPKRGRKRKASSPSPKGRGKKGSASPAKKKSKEEDTKEKEEGEREQQNQKKIKKDDEDSKDESAEIAKMKEEVQELLNVWNDYHDRMRKTFIVLSVINEDEEEEKSNDNDNCPVKYSFSFSRQEKEGQQEEVHEGYVLLHRGRPFLSPLKEMKVGVCDRVLAEARKLGDEGFAFEEDELEELQIEHIYWPFEGSLSDFLSYIEKEEDPELVFAMSQPIYHPDDNLWVGVDLSTQKYNPCNLG